MNERIARILNNPRLVPVAVGFVAFGAGTGLGYILCKRNTPKLVEITDQLDLSPGDEIVEIKQNTVRPAPVIIGEEFHTTFNKSIEENQTPMSVVNSKVTTDNIQYDKVGKVDSIVDKVDVEETVEEVLAEEETIRKSLFATNGEEWNYDSEIQHRNPSLPYIIHKDEFFEDSMQYAQVTLTYYAGDNILVDENESPIYNHEAIVGTLRFGHGSDDPNVVYVRNDKRKAEYEILFDSGMYSVEVLGLELDVNERARDLKHSRDRKFRPE